MNKKTTKMALTAMFTAMIFVLTLLHIPVASGYVHLGDALVYLVASTLGGPWALLAAALGAAIADLASGYAVYAPASLIVKILIAVPFALVNKKSERILTPLTALLTIPSGAITVLGYYIADLIINKIYAVADIPGNLIQAVGSAVLFIVIAGAFDAVKIKKKLFLEKSKKNG